MLTFHKINAIPATYLQPRALVLYDYVNEETGDVFSFVVPTSNEDPYGWYSELRLKYTI